MIKRRFPIVLLIALMLMSGSLHAMAVAASINSYGYDSEGKKDDPPRPKPPRGPRDGDDDN